MSEAIELAREIKNIDIFVGNAQLGLLTHGAHYSYQPIQEKQHVSLTMTRPGMQAYNHGTIHPVFAQNLPEGSNRRFIADKLARYAKVNDMYLLALQSDQGIGMLAYRSEINLPEVESLSLSEILSYQSQEPLFPQLLEKYYLRNALAGMQPKVSIPNAIIDRSFVETERTVQQKNLIVKTYDEDFPLLTVNEYVCMGAASHCGLNPPKTYLSENLETYIVERFDTSDDGIKLGYEDFATLMKKSADPDSKYQGSYEAVLKATEIYTRSPSEVEKMYKYIVFNCLIGNGDAHLKNFALQYTPDMQHIFVSPPFDITHTLIYENIDSNMALKLSGSKEFPVINDLIKLAEHDTIKVRNAKEVIEKMCVDIKQYLQQSAEVQLLTGLRESIEANISRVMHEKSTTAVYRHVKKKKHV